MRTIERTGRFKRDYRRESRGRHGTFLDASLMRIVEILALSGEWSDHRDCHVKPDLVL